jgi:DNA-binding NtrC family response regulator
MPLHAQVKLLRVIQNKEIRPIGANKTRHIDVRIIAATNRDLREEIFEKRFREDLFYRLNVIPVHISPLRERKEDVEDIAKYFIKQYAPAGEPYTLSPDAIEKLRNHDWPGNIRELENVIQRTLCFTDPGIITADDLQIEEMASHPQYQGQGIATTGIKSYDAFQQMQQQQLAQQQMQMQAEMEQAKMQQTDMINQRDNETKLLVANMQALSKRDADGDGIVNEGVDTQDLQEKIRQFDQKLKLDRDKLEWEKKKNKDNNDVKLKIASMRPKTTTKK